MTLPFRFDCPVFPSSVCPVPRVFPTVPFFPVFPTDCPVFPTVRFFFDKCPVFPFSRFSFPARCWPLVCPFDGASSQ